MATYRNIIFAYQIVNNVVTIQCVFIELVLMPNRGLPNCDYLGYPSRRCSTLYFVTAKRCMTKRATRATSNEVEFSLKIINWFGQVVLNDLRVRATAGCLCISLVASLKSPEDIWAMPSLSNSRTGSTSVQIQEVGA